MPCSMLPHSQGTDSMSVELKNVRRRGRAQALPQEKCMELRGGLYVNKEDQMGQGYKGIRIQRRS